MAIPRVSNGGRSNSISSTEKGNGRWSTLFLAYKTLGVVFGGLVTSPLYVYPSMNLNLQSPTEDEYLGIYGIMFWALTLIGVVRYSLIALRADDQGEGVVVSMVMLITTILVTLVMIMI